MTTTKKIVEMSLTEKVALYETYAGTDWDEPYCQDLDKAVKELIEQFGVS